MSELKKVILDTPIGRIGILVRDGMLELIELMPDDYSNDMGEETTPGLIDEQPFRAVKEFLDRYFAGELEVWKLDRLPPGGQFYQKVWRILTTIRFGETISYGALAALAGNPGSARAVGSAMARNPLPILIPCHRVIASNGGLGGYGGGLDMKRWLLRHEGVEL